jgi:hypothetical protein
MHDNAGRFPDSLSQGSRPALAWDTWQSGADSPRYPPQALCHDGLAQRWLVVSVQAALERAAAPLPPARPSRGPSRPTAVRMRRRGRTPSPFRPALAWDPRSTRAR